MTALRLLRAQLHAERAALDAVIAAVDAYLALVEPTPDAEPAPAPPVAPVARRTRRPYGYWRAEAMRALGAVASSLTIGEILDLAGVPQAERETAKTGVWAALSQLVKEDQVEHIGTRYRLVRAGEAA